MQDWNHFQINDAFVNGMRLRYWSAGSGPAVILLHGWMGKAYSWRKVAPLLAEKATIIVPDMRGYGESDKPATGYDGLTLKEDIRALAAHLGLKRPFIVGHDMGALPAFLYAAEHPDEVAGLGYFDEPLPGFNLDDYTIFRAPIGGFWWFGFNFTPGLSELLLVGKERAFIEFIMSAMIANKAALTSEDFDEYARTYRGPDAIAGSVGWYRAVLETAEQMREAGQRRLSVPVLALGGQYGIAGTFEQMKLVADRVEGGVIPYCGHLIPEEAPDAVATYLIDFMQRHA
ncbi:MAG: alpha/beta hydrolase [Chitinophagales bacterium]|nr:alpha/beta hydrolase [Hyphomicrobiales bacterium]